MTKTNIFAYQNQFEMQSLLAKNSAGKGNFAAVFNQNALSVPQREHSINNFFDAINELDSAAGNNNCLNANIQSGQGALRSQGSSSAHLGNEKSEKNREERERTRSKNNLTLLKSKISQLKSDCYSGSSGALEKLDKLATGQGDERVSLLNSQDLNELINYANDAMQELVGNAHNSPRLLSTFMKAKKLSTSGMEDLKPEKLIKDSAFSSAALQMVTRLANDGMKMDNPIKQAMGSNAGKAIWGLTYLAQENIPKSARLSIAQSLSTVAKEKSGSYTGVLAAKALKSIVKSEGQNGVMEQAFEGLKNAGTAGNDFALHSLEEIANDHTVSYNKATKAVKAISGVAKDNPNGPSGAKAVKSLYRVIHQQGENSILRAAFNGLEQASMNGNGKSVDALGSVALNSNLSLNKAKKAIDALGNVVQSGQGQASKAFGVLNTLATDKDARFSVKQMARQKIHSIAGEAPSSLMQANTNTNVFNFQNSGEKENQWKQNPFEA